MLLATLLILAASVDTGSRAVLVLPIAPGADVDSPRVLAVQDALRKGLRSVDGVRFLGTQEDNGRMQGSFSTMSCKDIECAAELGLSLGVPEVLHGTLTYAAGKYTLKLARVSTRTTRPLRESTRTVGLDRNAILTPIPDMVDELYPSDRSCRTCPPPPGSASETAAITPSTAPSIAPAFPRGPDVTWMLPALVGAGVALAITLSLGIIPFALSAIAFPVFTGWWLSNWTTALSPVDGPFWTALALLLPAMMGIPVGFAAPLVAGIASVLGWYLPTWLWRRNSPSLKWVLLASLPPVVIGGMLVAVPMGVAALAATGVVAPLLFRERVSIYLTLPAVIALYGLAWMGAAVTSWVTGMVMMLVPPVAVGLALSRDASPLRKGEDDEPLPVDELLKSLDDGGRRRR